MVYIQLSLYKPTAIFHEKWNLGNVRILLIFKDFLMDFEIFSLFAENIGSSSKHKFLYTGKPK